MYSYKSTTPNELSIYPGQLIQLAPREVQQTHKLLNTGWALATIDDKTSGLVPINYVRRVETKPHQNQTYSMPEQQQQQTSMIVPDMEPNVECVEKLNASFSQDWIGEKKLNTINEIVTNQCNRIDDTMIPADLNDLNDQ